MSTQRESGLVPRVSIQDLSPARFYRDYQRKGTPVVITGALDTTPALNIDTLLSHVGQMEVPIRCYGTSRFDRPKAEWKSYSETETLTVQAYCARLGNGIAARDHQYLAMVEMGHTPLRQIIGPGIDAIASHTGLVRRLPNDVNLWVGPGGHVEPLHYDGQDGTLSQFHGTKRVSLFAPAIQEGLYPFPMSHGGLTPNFSQVYIDQPDFDTYPKLAQALRHRQVVELAAGETLYIPLGWWHEVEALGKDYICSVNRFWKVAPLWRYATAPHASYLYGLSLWRQRRRR